MGTYLLLVINNYNYNYRILARTEGKTPLGRSRPRGEHDIKTDLKEVGCGGMDWINMAQDTRRCQELVNAVMNLRVP
jgi:hypothetical protein